MTFFNKKILSIKKNPITIFKIDDFFDLEFYSDIKKLFSNINPKNIDLAKSLGKVHFNSNQLVFDDITKKKIFSKLNEVIFSDNFFYFFIKHIYFKNLLSQKNYFRKIKYLRYPIIDSKKKKFFDFFFSKLSVSYEFSYIKNNGGIVPHVDAQRKYLSLLLYFPDDEKKEIDYGTTFWISKIQNHTNKHFKNDNEINDFKSKSTILFKTPFVPNTLYGFLRNDSSWHTVEPVNVNSSYIRKSININFNYNN
tara:strand:+ start:337 stop:1089 length:753 start_codon:yes stop_codon:yes gene_type:complete